MRSGRSLMAAVCVLTMPHFAYAQSAADYPNRPVRVIVPAATGGGTDIAARILAHKLGETLNRQFVVENRAGAGNTIGYGYVAKAAPDGYTLLATTPTFTFTSALRPNLPYDPVRDFAPISLVAKTPYLLVAHPALPVRSIKELVALARAKPGALDMAVGYGSFTHIASVYFASAAKIKVTIVPYKGGNQDTMDAIAGQVHMLLGSLLSNLPYVRSGKLRALGVSTAERSKIMPEIPSISESGIAFDVTSWQGWMAPTGTPQTIVAKLSAELAKAVRSPDVAKSFTNDGGVPVGSTPEEFRALINEEVPRWSKVVRDTGMRVE